MSLDDSSLSGPAPTPPEVLLFSPFSVVDMDDESSSNGIGIHPSYPITTAPSYVNILTKIERIPENPHECVRSLPHLSDYLLLLPPHCHIGSVQHIMTVFYITHILESTIGNPLVFNRLTFSNQAAKKTCADCWEMWQGYLRDDVQFKLEEIKHMIDKCSQATKSVKLHRDFSHTIYTLHERLHLSILVVIVLLPLLLNWVLIVQNVHVAAQVPVYVWFCLMPVWMRWVMATRSKYAEIQRRARDRCMQYFCQHVVPRTTLPEGKEVIVNVPVGSPPTITQQTVFENNMGESMQSTRRSSVVLTPHNVPREGLLFLQDCRGMVVRLSSNDVVTNRVLIIGFTKCDMKVVYWSYMCESATGFMATEVLGNTMQTILADDKSKQAVLTAAKNTGSCTMYIPGADVLHLNLLSEVTVTVSVKFHVIESKDVTGVEDSGTVYLLGVTSDSSGVVTNCTKAYVQYVNQELKHVFNKLKSSIPSLQQQENVMSEPYQLSTEVSRLIDLLHTNKIQTAVATWVSFSSHFVPHHLIGQVIEEFTPTARSRVISLAAHIANDVPTGIYWDDGRLFEIVSYLVQVALSHTPRGGCVRISANRVFIGECAVLQVAVTDSSTTPESTHVTELIELGVITGLNVLHESLDMSTSAVQMEGSGGVNGNSFVGKTIVEYDTGDKLARLTQSLEISGGKLMFHSNTSGNTMTVQIPIMRPDLDRSINQSMDTSSSNNDKVVADEFVAKEHLEVAVYEPSSVYYMGIAHFLWGRSHSVIQCKEVDTLLYAIDERKPNVVMYDIDSVAGTNRYEEVKAKAEEYDAMFIVLSCMDQSHLYARCALKPISEVVLQEYMKAAVNVVVSMKQREAQVSMMRQLFSEHKMCEWEKGECVGVGTFGEVYLATSTLTGGRMAVKIIPLDTQSPEIKARTEDLINEIDILRTMEHPNVIHYFYCERVEGAVNIFMEYASGGSLAQLMQKKKLTPTRIVRIISEVLEAVGYIHDMGIVHRDIKSANILLAGRRVKLADFGTATRLREGHASGTKGTLRWMAPEVLNSKTYDHMCDIWSVGCLLIELITNEVPFRNSFPNHLALADYISNLQPDTCMEHGIEDPLPYLDSFLRSCLQVNPALRGTARTLLSHPFITSRQSTGDNMTAASTGGGYRRGSGVSLSGSSSMQYSDRSGSRRPSATKITNIPNPRHQRESIFGQSVMAILRKQYDSASSGNESSTNTQSSSMFPKDTILVAGVLLDSSYKFGDAASTAASSPHQPSFAATGLASVTSIKVGDRVFQSTDSTDVVNLNQSYPPQVTSVPSSQNSNPANLGVEKKINRRRSCDD